MPSPDDPTAPVERRLATILVADVFGYSRMMGENEERTVRILRGHRAVFDEMLAAHRGRVFNTAGDAILAEFPSAVEAVRCATEIQSALRTRNEQLPDDQRMWFRIGINLGDVVVQDTDLLGDGVNIAARIEGVAEPGGVCISGSVYDQIQNKLSLQFRQLGEKSFKNIAQPVRTFAITDDTGGARPAIRGAAAPGTAPAALVAGIVAAVVVLAAAGWWLWRDDAQQAEAARAAAAAKQQAAQAQATATAQKEANLAAELAAAKEALAQSEADKQKAEAAKAAAEGAQREAKLAAELRAAKDALQKAAPASAPGAPVAPVAPPTAAAPAAAHGGVDRFDGIYAGRVCKVIRDGSTRCFPVSLTAQHGVLAASWTNRASGAKAHATGTIGADGAATLALDAFDLTGAPVKGSMRGRWADHVITLAGTFDDGTPANATLTWAPEGAAGSRGPGRAARRN